jgi:hypothetical protein
VRLIDRFWRNALLAAAIMTMGSWDGVNASQHLTVSGTVTGQNEKVPAAFADVLVNCRDRVCSTDAAGRMNCVIRTTAVTSVCIEHPVLGRTRLDLAGRVGAVDLNSVALIPGATIRVVKPPHIVLPENSTVALLRNDQEVAAPRRFSDVDVEDFNGLAPGTYAVALRGPSPLQRKHYTVELVDREISELALSLDPYRLHGEIRFGKDALAATVTLAAEDWSAEVKSDEDGRFEADVWESTVFGVVVEANNLEPSFLTSLEASPSASTWQIHIPNRKMSGAVLDGETRKPIAGATIFLKSESGGTSTTRVVSAQDNGNFVVMGLADGRYSFSAKAEGYAAEAPVVVTLRPFDGDQTSDLLLWRGVDLPIQVTDAAGQPAANALLISNIDDPSQARLQRADGAGRAVWFVRKGAVQTLFVLPATGGLAVVPLTESSQNDGKAHIVVPIGEAALRIQARDDDDSPLSGVTLKLRWNGVDIPFGVLRQFATLHKGRAVSDRSGEIVLPNLPLGRYEITWLPPDQKSGVGQPVLVTLTRGETFIKQTFRVFEAAASQ